MKWLKKLFGKEEEKNIRVHISGTGDILIETDAEIYIYSKHPLYSEDVYKALKSYCVRKEILFRKFDKEEE